MVEKEDPRIQYGDLYGLILSNDQFFDDKEVFKNEIINYKIINIKIYFNSCLESQTPNNLENENGEKLNLKEHEENMELADEKYIIGLTITYKNIYNGQVKVMEHKCSDKIAGMKELNIKGNENLKAFNINIKDDFYRISQLAFFTNYNNSISVGSKEGEDKIENKNKEDNVIVGCFGHFTNSINALGCIYVNRKIFIEKLVFGFFLLRKIVKGNKKFKEEWDEKYRGLDIDYQYMWKMVNLPDNSFSKIIQFCFL